MDTMDTMLAICIKSGAKCQRCTAWHAILERQRASTCCTRGEGRTTLQHPRLSSVLHLSQKMKLNTVALLHFYTRARPHVSANLHKGASRRLEIHVDITKSKQLNSSTGTMTLTST